MRLAASRRCRAVSLLAAHLRRWRHLPRLLPRSANAAAAIFIYRYLFCLLLSSLSAVNLGGVSAALAWRGGSAAALSVSA